jgi:hypothetical protein
MIISSSDFSYSKLRVVPSWNMRNDSELRMHKIHNYPAKFPAFLVTKAIELAKSKNIKVKKISDIFCGCGTTALEAKNNSIDFIGYDINPVATLIAKVKSENYNLNRIDDYYKLIIRNLQRSKSGSKKFFKIERIKYWFEEKQIIELTKLYAAINAEVPKGKYKSFFYCAFSNILKPTSRWLTKSIKPQIDQFKRTLSVLNAFELQIKMMRMAIKELPRTNSKVDIQTKNIITAKLPVGEAQLLVSSPPYVTSYEYADLHQLSLLWLGFADDFRKFRKGSVGSLYHQKLSTNKLNTLNEVGKIIYSRLSKVDKRKAVSVAKYFLDVDTALQKSYDILKPGGLLFFVMGNTTYKGVKIDNVKYLINCILNRSFADIEIRKRKISSKILTPYRDKKGKFSKSSRGRKVYQYEYIITARRTNGIKS